MPIDRPIRFEVRFTAAEFRVLRDYAKANGLSLPAWVRLALAEAAKERK